MNNYRYYKCHLAAIRARNPAFKELWKKLAVHFEKEFINENK